MVLTHSAKCAQYSFRPIPIMVAYLSLGLVRFNVMLQSIRHSVCQSHPLAQKLLLPMFTIEHQ